MSLNYQKGKTIFGVIAVISVIALLCLLFVYICKSTHISNKTKEIAEAVANRIELYCPDIPINSSKLKSKKYAQNGPHGTTILLQDEDETPQPEKGKLYFSVVVDTASKSICKKLIETDVFKAELFAIDEDLNGKCPGVIRFYFTCPYKLNSEELVDTVSSYEGTDFSPHFTFAHHESDSVNNRKSKCREPIPYENEAGDCVECITSSQCHETQDCIENMCEDCPKNSNRIVRVGQRIGTRDCYCKEGYQLNDEATGCISESKDWDIKKNCIGNHCSVCPENSNHKKGQRVASTDCYCEEGYLPRQTSVTQWQCAKVAILYPETSNQIIIHEEKYPVKQKEKVVSSMKDEKYQPIQRRVSQNSNENFLKDEQLISDRNFMNYIYLPVFEDLDTLFDSAFMQIPNFVFFPMMENWDVQGMESLEIIVR